MESTSARTTAGMDFYDVFRLDARRWGFFLGHVLTEARTGDGGLLGQDGVVAILDGERIRGPPCQGRQVIRCRRDGRPVRH